MTKLYQQIAMLVIARQNCLKTVEQYHVEVINPEKTWKEAIPRESAVAQYYNAKEMAATHTARINDLIDRFMPHGSGWDSGTKIDLDLSHANKLTFYGSFHHLDENGFYDGWTDHSIIVTPSLAFEFNLRITGRNRNDIKEDLNYLFSNALSEDIGNYLESQRRTVRMYYKRERARMWKHYSEWKHSARYPWMNKGSKQAVTAYHDARIRASWDEFECSEHQTPVIGSVRLQIVSDDSISIDDLKGDTFNRAGCGEHMSEQTMQQQEKEFEDKASNDGVWGIVGEYFDGSKWIHVDSCFGFVGDDWKDSGTDIDIMATTLKAAAECRKDDK